MYKRTDTKTGPACLFLWSLLLIFGAAAGATDDQAVVADQPGETTQETAKVDLSNGCFIEFIAFDKDSSIRDGLRLLAARCKKNIVPSAKVDGPLTVSRLYDVTFDEALASILGHGFKYEQEGDFVRKGESMVATLVPLKPMVIESYKEIPQLGRFAVRDMGMTVAVGIVQKVPPRAK